MPKRRILFSWIGHHDLLAAAADGDVKLQADFVAELKLRRTLPLPKQAGPVKTLLDQESFDEVHLLGDYKRSLSSAYLNWLGHKVIHHAVKISDPTDYGQILEAVEGVLKNFHRNSDSEFSFLLTPGTPSMAATWILIGKARYDGIFWQTHEGNATKSVVPFDVVAGFASDIAAVPDVSLQHLATTAPSEIAGFGKISGSSKSLKLAAGRAAKASVRDVPVLILGGAGTGKELFAEAIHAASHRCEKPFIKVNCAAIPDQLLEAQLFGYLKGSFTGAAKDQPGMFEKADGGTLFLDEVGECSPAMQAALLRVLQPPQGKGSCFREFSPVGDVSVVRQCDVRIVNATNR